MQKILALGGKLNGKTGALLLLLPVVAAALFVITVWDVEELLEFIVDYLPILMFVTLASLLFSGYPVAFILGGVALLFGLIGYSLGVFSLIEFFNFVPRIWGQAAENLVLVAVPTFVFMGVMMERSGIAEDLLYAVQVLMRKVPGSLALAVTVMGTILAAMTGIIGASVTMMTALALPTMLRQGYSHALATGCIAASGTLGILIPPSIMLIIMADLLSISVGNLFMSALGPGLMLAFFYLLYIVTASGIKPEIAPPLPPEMLHVPARQMPPLILVSFLPPAALLALVKGSILFGWATPSEAGAVGAFGAVMLPVVIPFLVRRFIQFGLMNPSENDASGRMLIKASKRYMTWEILKGVNHTAALTIAMIFFIVMSATCFAYVFRSLGGDDVVSELIVAANFGSWGLLILILAIVFLLGFFLDWIEITLIILPIFAPLVATFDFGDHVPLVGLNGDEVTLWFTVLVAVNLQTSFLTPPFGFALFYMKGIAPPEVHITSIYKGIVPFVLLQLFGLIAVMIFPMIALWLPGLAYGV
ncbi:MAG: TRAP transporter large permease subunit [SAR324 cluster bacterium]|nr:TRAP transporter large permease subunit [SAR324 cluster bacterium]